MVFKLIGMALCETIRNHYIGKEYPADIQAIKFDIYTQSQLAQPYDRNTSVFLHCEERSRSSCLVVRSTTRAHGLAWPILVALGAIDPGSNPGGPINISQINQ